MIQLSNDLNKGNTTASQVIKEELPFDVYAYEKEYGPIRTQEELCPGNLPNPKWTSATVALLHRIYRCIEKFSSYFR